MATFPLLRLGWSIALSAAIAIFAYRRSSLAKSGALAALFVGTAIGTGGGGAWFLALCTFFFTSTALAKVGRARKEAIKREFSKGDTRDVWQVLANGGVAAACALGNLALPSPLWLCAFLGAMATANGDTWATEIGPLSRGEPVNLVKLRRVPRGTSGAVSLIGILASAGGALVIGAGGSVGAQNWIQAVRFCLVATVAGTLGSLIDSLLGATLQAGFFCQPCQRHCESEKHHCGAEAPQVRGLSWFGNDAVNAASTLSGAVFGALLAALWNTG